MDITFWILKKKVYLISLKLNLINYFEKFNKCWKNWTYGVYSWQNNTHHKVLKHIFHKVQIENCHAWFENQIQFYAKKKNHKNDNF
jgi:hypothetical protein